MKKSTILLLAVVYIVSFFVIGLLGHSIRNYNPEIYPESIEIVDPDNRTTMTRDTKDPDTGELLYDYYFVYKNYKEGDSVRIKASIKPDNSTYQNVIFTKDASDTSFKIETHETNENIEQNFALITLTGPLTGVISTPFLVSSTNPGTQIKLKVCITFVDPSLSFQLL